MPEFIVVQDVRDRYTINLAHVVMLKQSGKNCEIHLSGGAIIPLVGKEAESLWNGFQNRVRWGNG
jgi:hypothetical protein